MLATVDPAVGFGASTRIILLRSCDIAGCQSITLWQNRPSGLELDDIAMGFSYHWVGERHTCSVPRAGDQPARAPSGDYLIANSPFRHLQEPWHDAAPLRSPRLGPDLPPPPADLAGRRSPGTVNLALAACASASRWVVGWDDDSCSRPLCRLPVPRRDHQPRRLAVFQV